MPKFLSLGTTSIVILAILASTTGAQITLENNAAPPPLNPTITTVGAGIAHVVPGTWVGAGCVARAATAANASFIPTGVPLDPVRPGGNSGFTIQFAFRPQGAPAAAAWYMLGDPLMVSPLGGPSGGAFRVFRDGVAGANNLIVRGVPAQLSTVGAPLAAALNPAGWVHITLRYNSAPIPAGPGQPAVAASTLAWFINGARNNAVVAAPFNWRGTDLSIVGYAGSASQAAWGEYDEIRIYDFPRGDPDIAADWAGPPIAVPNQVYLHCDTTLDPHLAFIGANGDLTGAGTRLITAGTVLEWGANSPPQLGNPATILMNFNGRIVGTPGIINPHSIALRPAPAMPIAHVTAPVPGLQVGHLFSAPAAPFSLAFPDGLGIGFITNLSIPIPYAYGAPNLVFATPAGLFNTGDRIDLQGVAVDPAYRPFGIASTNRVTFVYADCARGEHCHVEARGIGAIQVTGFWEVWNTGTVDITQVKIDALTAVGGAVGFNPAGALNSGGTLAAGTSYRWSSDAFCGLFGPWPGLFTCLIPAAIPPCRGLQFDFNSFDSCTDIFSFDCDSSPSNLNGNAYVGSTVSVTYANGRVHVGLMILDPNDPRAAIIDF